MTRRDDEDWPEGFAEALRRRAVRGPAVAPAEAARRVRARLPPRRRPRRGWLVPATALTAMLLALATLTTRTARESQEPASPDTVVIGPLPDNIVVWWADPETPVYFIVGPPATDEGGKS